jgi:CRISPR-associated endonuclease Cas1
MKGNKVLSLALESGSFLGRSEGCLTVRDCKGQTQKYPLVSDELGQIEVRSGSTISVGAMVSMAYWGIDLVVSTARGRPVGVLKSLDNSAHVLTRVFQYETLKTAKALGIAKRFVLSKLRGQDQVLSKYGLRRNDYAVVESINKLETKTLAVLQRQLRTIEGHASKTYFQQIFGLFPESLRPKKRQTFKAYDRANNLFNLGYTTLSWKVHLALLGAKLEPYLGYLHWINWGTPALVCDFEELYRYLVDDYVLGYALKLSDKDFVLKDTDYGFNKKGKREYLREDLNKAFFKGLNDYFTRSVEVPRIRKGRRQKIETLINEEALLFAKYLREEIPTWNPRIANLKYSNQE